MIPFILKIIKKQEWKFRNNICNLIYISDSVFCHCFKKYNNFEIFFDTIKFVYIINSEKNNYTGIWHKIA